MKKLWWRTGQDLNSATFEHARGEGKEISVGEETENMNTMAFTDRLIELGEGWSQEYDPMLLESEIAIADRMKKGGNRKCG